MKKEIKAVLFDWDGCLFNSLVVWLETCRIWLTKSQVNLHDRVIARHIIPELKAAKDYGVADLDTFHDGVLKEVMEKIHYGAFNIGALELIKKLAEKGVGYVIVTSSLREMIEKTLNHHQVQELFPHVITRDDVVKRKPDPEPILKALELLGLSSDEVMIVGDSIVDVQAGKAAGIQTVLYYPADHELFYDEETLLQANPDFVVRSLAEVIDLIN